MWTECLYKLFTLKKKKKSIWVMLLFYLKRSYSMLCWMGSSLSTFSSPVSFEIYGSQTVIVIIYFQDLDRDRPLQQKRQNNPLRSDEAKAVYPLSLERGDVVLC